jgi:hypothetical protein
MANHSSSPPIEAEDCKPASTPVTTSTTATHIPNPEATSSSIPTPPPHPVFTDAQREVIMELRRDNDEQKFRQEMMEKCLDWLLDSGVKNPAQRRNEEELLQEIMAPKWSDSSRHAFPYNSTNK